MYELICANTDHPKQFYSEEQLDTALCAVCGSRLQFADTSVAARNLFTSKQTTLDKQARFWPIMRRELKFAIFWTILVAILVVPLSLGYMVVPLEEPKPTNEIFVMQTRHLTTSERWVAAIGATLEIGFICCTVAWIVSLCKWQSRKRLAKVATLRP